MTICYEEFILAKFITIIIISLIAHLLVYKLILAKKITNKKQLWMVNIIIFAIYMYIGYSYSLGFDNCPGKDGPIQG